MRGFKTAEETIVYHSTIVFTDCQFVFAAQCIVCTNCDSYIREMLAGFISLLHTDLFVNIKSSYKGIKVKKYSYIKIPLNNNKIQMQHSLAIIPFKVFVRLNCCNKTLCMFNYFSRNILDYSFLKVKTNGKIYAR